MIIAESQIRIFAHAMKIMVTDKGEIKFSFDSEEVKNAKKFEDGKIFFIGTEELVVKGELKEYKYIEIPVETYNKLASVQAQILNEIEQETSSALLMRETQSDTLKRVDRWRKKIKKYKENKVKKTYAVHDFTIGAQSYRFYERRLISKYSSDGILINPAYSVERGFPAGAVPVKRGELMFWLYYTDDDGWQTVREMTLNEMTCVDIIRKHGMVAMGKMEG